jgi:hypothetical protein
VPRFWAPGSEHNPAIEPPIPEAELAQIAEETSQTERRAAEAERELVEWKKVRFMQDRVGEEFAALVLNPAKFGLFVELTDLFVEGLVPIDSLRDDRYTWRENTHEIIGERTGRRFRAGDHVQVILDRILAPGAPLAVLHRRRRSAVDREKGPKNSPQSKEKESDQRPGPFLQSPQKIRQKGQAALDPRLLCGQVANHRQFIALPVHGLQYANQPNHKPRQPDQPRDEQEEKRSKHQAEHREKAQRNGKNNRRKIQEDRLPCVEAHKGARIVRRENQEHDCRDDGDVRDSAGRIVAEAGLIRFGHNRSFQEVNSPLRA